MGKITFILGGARSGKSQYAIRLAEETSKTVLFIATASGLDKEMKLRIKLHKRNRPCHWKTIEEPKNLLRRIESLSQRFDLAIIDCLTIFISNLLLGGNSDARVEKEVNSTLKALKKSKFNSIIISNEVGLGIVPDNPLARRFRDLAGRINQRITQVSDTVYFVISGLPLKIKGE